MEYGSEEYIEVDDEFEKLMIRMNPPRVTVDNTSSRNVTLVKVDSANKYGILLEVVQVLTDLNLTIRRAYISSDGEWFMDVFYVVDQYGNKLSDEEVIDKIQRSLVARELSLRSFRRLNVGNQPAPKHTAIELTGRDRPGLLSEVFANLANHSCNVVSSEIWTHNSRMASVIYITDGSSGLLINDPDRLTKIKHLLRNVMRGDRDNSGAKAAISLCTTHTERRLHQMMYADRDYDRRNIDLGGDGRDKPVVSVENYADKEYSVVNVRCKDRPKLLFDTVCTLTDMQYVVSHATFNSEGPAAYQEYYIRHVDGYPVSSEGERQRIILCLEAAITRRSYDGMRLELCGDDRPRLLADVTRIFREHGLTVTRAEVTTEGTQATNTFYVADPSGDPVSRQTIEAVRNEIGETTVHVFPPKTPPSQSPSSSFGSLFRSRSEKLLCNLGLIRS